MDTNRTLRTRITLALAFAASGFFLSPHAAEATGGGRGVPGPACFPLIGTIQVQLTADGCTSPVGLCTRGTFRSGYISGTTRYTASGLGGGAVGEDSIVTPPSEPATTWSYAGELTITTRLGSITFSDAGVLDNVAGTFTELNRPIRGTGSFEGVTGRMFVSGDITGGGTGFDGVVTGRICVPIDD